MDELILKKVIQLKNKYRTNDPFELLEELGVTIKYNDDFSRLKAFYFIMLGIPYVVINDRLDQNEKKIVAAHELGHHVLHKHLAKTEPIREIELYDMKSSPEYEANLFASELLVEDSEIEDILKEEPDYFKICSILNIPPELMAFKINSMNRRGFAYKAPLVYKSDFLAK